MYNRYIPQGDGSYRKTQLPEPPEPPVQASPSGQEPMLPPPGPPPKPQSATSFLGRLLPRGLDTGDLLILVLLLLMAGDCQEDKNTALLTLALYLFL